jgi:hypothetical protein
MTDTATLRTQLEELKKARATGARAIQYDDMRIEYKSDDEMVRAIANIEAELAGSTVNTVVIRSNKGW